MKLRTMSFGSTAAIVALFGVAGLVSPALAYDYLVKAAPPNLVKDDATTLLADFSAKGKPAALFSAGASPAVAGKALPDGGFRGTVSFASAQNFAPSAWTVEMVLRLPQESAKTDVISLGGWQAANGYSLAFNLTNGWGARCLLYGSKGVDGRVHEFQALSTAGGNGFSLHANAVGQWVYISFGIDFARQKATAIVRDMDGNVLQKNLNFVSQPGLLANFLQGIPEAQHQAATDRSWSDMARSFPKGVPPRITFGNAAVELMALRISKKYRDDVLDLNPAVVQPGETVWTATELDPERATIRKMNRSIGYPGYNNERSVMIDDSLLPLSPDGKPVTISLKDMKIGIYSFYIYGSVDAKGRTALDRVWKPCPIEFEAKDAAGKRVEIGRRLLKQSLGLRAMQAFVLHVNVPGDYTVAFKLLPAAQETPLIQRVVMADDLAGVPDEAIKKSQNIAKGKTAQLKTLTEARKRRDDAIWAALPSANLQLQVHGQVKDFLTPPVAANLPTWETKVFVGLPGYNRPGVDFAPLDMINTKTKEVLTNAQVISGVPWPGPHADDGTGIYLTKKEFPELAHDIYYTPRALLLGERVYLFLGLLGTWDWRGAGLPIKYFETGDPNVGHDAAMALVRLAYDWPAVDMTFHELRLCTGTPDFEYNTDWSAARQGKYFYEGWTGSEATDFMNDYDQLFPYIKDNQIFADEVHRFIPWVKTPQDVVRFLDRWLVLCSVSPQQGRMIRGVSEDIAGQVLGPHKDTAKLFDLTSQFADIYPCQGTFQELYATALSRSGCYYIASFMVYALGDAEGLVNKAYTLRQIREAGMPVPMDLSDVNKYPRVRGAANFMINMWVAGGFPFMAGDASGGPHNGAGAAEAILRRDHLTIQHAFELLGNAPRFAYLLKNMFGSKDPAVLKAAEGVRDPIRNAESHVVPDWAAFIECNPDQTDLTKKTAATVRLGIGRGHAHNDYLDLNLFGMGLPLAVDLACRNEGGFWSRPGASWSFLHNHAIAHDEENPATAGGQTGEPWLRAFAPPLVRASYVNQKGDGRLDRDVILMPLGDTGNSYAFDLQRLKGGKMHTWCFHGCESNDLALNVPMEPKTVRWTDRTLDGTHKVGASADLLQATWTMTRQAKDYPHTFTGGGIVKTVVCEQAALGKSYDPKLPPVHVRATLLGHGGETVLQGNPYSQAYGYCFPFLWVQSPAKAESVYPALYEWYRGDAPVIVKAELVRKEPLTVRVTTSTGQVDEYTASPETEKGGAPAPFAAVSRDAKGLRWAKFSGAANCADKDLSFKTVTGNYHTSILSIDYGARTLQTRDPLPENPSVVIGNAGRQCWLDLHGKGTSFTWDDDLLIHEGQITDIKVLDKGTVKVATNQEIMFGDLGNRKTALAFVQANEDGSWQFRNGIVIRKPEGGELTPKVFADANGDGRVDLKTWEIGLGDTVTLPAEITVRRAEEGYEMRTNVNVAGALAGGGFPFKLTAGDGWQKLPAR